GGSSAGGPRRSGPSGRSRLTCWPTSRRWTTSSSSWTNWPSTRSGTAAPATAAAGSAWTSARTWPASSSTSATRAARVSRACGTSPIWRRAVAACSPWTPSPPPGPGPERRRPAPSAPPSRRNAATTTRLAPAPPMHTDVPDPSPRRGGDAERTGELGDRHRVLVGRFGVGGRLGADRLQRLPRGERVGTQAVEPDVERVDQGGRLPVQQRADLAHRPAGLDGPHGEGKVTVDAEVEHVAP